MLFRGSPSGCLGRNPSTISTVPPIKRGVAARRSSRCRRRYMAGTAGTSRPRPVTQLESACPRRIVASGSAMAGSNVGDGDFRRPDLSLRWYVGTTRRRTSGWPRPPRASKHASPTFRAHTSNGPARTARFLNPTNWLKPCNASSCKATGQRGYLRMGLARSTADLPLRDVAGHLWQPWYHVGTRSELFAGRSQRGRYGAAIGAVERRPNIAEAVAMLPTPLGLDSLRLQNPGRHGTLGIPWGRVAQNQVHALLRMKSTHAGQGGTMEKAPKGVLTPSRRRYVIQRTLVTRFSHII